jgi:hypothetical protein
MQLPQGGRSLRRRAVWGSGVLPPESFVCTSGLVEVSSRAIIDELT